MKPSLLVLKIFDNVIFWVLNNDFPNLRILFFYGKADKENLPRGIKKKIEATWNLKFSKKWKKKKNLTRHLKDAKIPAQKRTHDNEKNKKGKKNH